ncbi:MAG TPA: hypothetical protein VGS12_08340 [Caulobacteraceae bacterium]|nr:hypothetical protein [Caulobacteraceae bacterium]
MRASGSALALALAALCAAPASAQPVAEASLRAHVQAFYKWYGRILADDSSNASADIRAIRARPSWFDPALARALEADEAASARNPGEIVGLDWDPFTNAQDVCRRYVVRGVRRSGAVAFADVFCDDPNFDPADTRRAWVTAQLQFRSGHWVFVDFLDPNNHGEGLMHALAGLAEERRKDGEK